MTVGSSFPQFYNFSCGRCGAPAGKMADSRNTNAHKSSSHFGGLCCPCVHQFYNLENLDIADLDLDADIHQKQ